MHWIRNNVITYKNRTNHCKSESLEGRLSMSSSKIDRSNDSWIGSWAHESWESIGNSVMVAFRLKRNM